MFSKGKGPEVPVTPAAPVPQAPVKRPSGRGTPSIISADLSITGTLVSQGDMQVDGAVEGDIRSVTLTIGATAVVKGDILAEEIVVRGRVEGRIKARRVQLDGSAVVIGDILQESLIVASGATFEGTCRRSSEPLKIDINAPMLVPSPRAAQPAVSEPNIVSISVDDAASRAAE